MNIEALRTYCLSKPGTGESMPFGEETLVFKVMDKLFALTGIDSESVRVNLKCDPERAVLLREEYPEEVLPGYHMNKQHWNTVICDSDLSDRLIRELIDHSYELVAAKLTKKMRDELATLS